MHLVSISTYNCYPLMEEGKLDQQVYATKSSYSSFVPMHMDQNGCSSYCHHKVRKTNIWYNASQRSHTQVKPKNGDKANDIVRIYIHQSTRPFIHDCVRIYNQYNIIHFQGLRGINVITSQLVQIFFCFHVYLHETFTLKIKITAPMTMLDSCQS